MTKNFSKEELMCKCGCGQLPNLANAKMLEISRHIGGCKPIIISSSMRCPVHNKNVCGANTSLHMFGFADDIIGWGDYRTNTPEGRKIIGDLFRNSGWYVIIEPTWIHIDLRLVFPQILEIRKSKY